MSPVHVIDALRWTTRTKTSTSCSHRIRCALILARNKVDKVDDKPRLLAFAAETTKSRDYASVHFLAARRGDGVTALLDDIVARIPEGDAAYGEDEMTDRSERFLAAEFIREQLMLRFSAELPYSIAVAIERFEDKGGVAHIGAVIWVERDGQKAMVIGAGGAALKSVGTAARKSMEKLFERKVFLELWVRVRESWSDDAAMLRKFGYEE